MIDYIHCFARDFDCLMIPLLNQLINVNKMNSLLDGLKKDCTGVMSADIKLLLLGTLQYLSRGLTFDDIEEATCISAEVHRVFSIFLYYLEAQ
jgi:hypothetical protein